MVERSVFEMNIGVKIWLLCQVQYDLSSEGIVDVQLMSIGKV